MEKVQFVSEQMESINSNNYHNYFTALFPGPPRWAGARRCRHTNNPAGRHSIRTNQCPPPPSPLFFTAQMPFLPPNQQCQSK